MKTTIHQLRKMIRKVIVESLLVESDDPEKIAAEIIADGPANQAGSTMKRGDVQKKTKAELRKRGIKFKHGEVNKAIQRACDDAGI